MKSVFLWLALFIGLLELHLFPLGVMIALGALSHVLIDGLTHAGKDFIETDTSLVWPLQTVLPKLGSVIGVWEYRTSKGSLMPKDVEIAVILTLIGAYILLP
jgi:membrane-bound metal-dependent hydrolase YbcI (DUF457 family)